MTQIYASIFQIASNIGKLGQATVGNDVDVFAILNLCLDL